MKGEQGKHKRVYQLDQHWVLWAKPPPVVLASHFEALVRVLAALFLIQLPADAIRKAPSTHVGHPGRVPSSWLQPGPALVIEAI